MSDAYKKVLFRLQQDADGYPPASVEGLWAKATEGGYEVDNIPFYVYGIAPGDIIGTQQVKPGSTPCAAAAAARCSGSSSSHRKPSTKCARHWRISAANAKRNRQ